MCGGNRVISSNCDSVVERALRPVAEKRDVRFGAGAPLALDNVPSRMVLRYPLPR
jgi:hypothetical protein